VLVQKPGGPWETDEEIADERYVAAAVKGKGVVVFSACSHAGKPKGLSTLFTTPGSASSRQDVIGLLLFLMI
jgi:hypothetical protein